MRRHITRTKSQISIRDKAWFVLECLEGEARSYVMSKLERETDEPDNVFCFCEVVLVTESVKLRYATPS